MFTDSKKSAVKIADWGLVKIEEPFTKDLENTAAPISATVRQLQRQQILIGDH